MATASAPPVYRSAAHRKAVMQHIGATLLPSAFAFGLAGPLIGATLIWGAALVALVCQAVAEPAAIPGMLMALWGAVSSAYIAAGFPAALTGIWVALLSPFAEDRSRYLAGAACIGAVTTFLFTALGAPIPGITGGALFLAIIGAVSAFICAWLFQNAPLGRDEARRTRLSRDRADRLAKERAKG